MVDDMTTEDKLKDFILTKYRSLREFTQEINMPYSTMTTILKRGIDNSNVQNIIKICQALEIKADDLAEGNIVPIERHNTDSVRIEDILFELTQKLLNTDNLTIDDKPATKEDVYLIISTLDTAMEIRKRQQERLAAYYNNLLKEG
jgi:predicted transcriptional regulator